MSATTTVTPITPDDLLRLTDRGKGFELVDGELKEMAVSKESSRIAGRIYYRLEDFCEANQPGWVYPEGTSYRCFPGDASRVRRADASFITLDRMPLATYRDEGHCTTAPDLVVEVISPRDLAEDVEEKLADWQSAGVKHIWIVNPTTRTVRVHRADGSYAFLRTGDTLTAPDILPGFACSVADLFRLPGEPAPALPAPV